MKFIFRLIVALVGWVIGIHVLNVYWFSFVKTLGGSNVLDYCIGGIVVWSLAWLFIVLSIAMNMACSKDCRNYQYNSSYY